MRHQLLCDSDWAGMGHSVEIRVPFVDVDLLRAVAPLLASEHPPSKRDMAAAASDFASPQLLQRRKTGFQVPVRDWLLEGRQMSDVRGHRSDMERGLRGWAKYVYRHFPGAQLRESNNRSQIRSHRSELNQRSTISNQQSARPNQQLAISNQQSARRILVFRIGQLGDTIVALPAMWLVRKHFPNAHITLLCDRHPGRSYVMASDLLRGSGIFDDYLSYPASGSGDLLQRGRMATLLTAIRFGRFDTLVRSRSRSPGPACRGRSLWPRPYRWPATARRRRDP